MTFMDKSKIVILSRSYSLEQSSMKKYGEESQPQPKD
jgi:hypothetical protein